MVIIDLTIKAQKKKSGQYNWSNISILLFKSDDNSKRSIYFLFTSLECHEEQNGSNPLKINMRPHRLARSRTQAHLIKKDLHKNGVSH